MKSLDEKLYPHVLLYNSKHLNTIRSPMKLLETSTKLYYILEPQQILIYNVQRSM